jgi:hypothetical protein
MTDLNVEAVARECLRRIALERPGACYAGRRGVCAGVQGMLRRPARTVLIRRRMDGGVWLEVWCYDSIGSPLQTIRRFALRPELAAEAVAVLDQV